MAGGPTRGERQAQDGVELWLEVLLVVALLGVLVLSVRRLQLLRRGTTMVVLRRLPVAEGRGWRHGTLRYDEDQLEFCRVSSLRLGPDLRVARQRLTVHDRRGATPAERDSVPVDATVLRFDDGGREAEVALSGGALTAFLSWVESSPPARRRRR